MIPVTAHDPEKALKDRRHLCQVEPTILKNQLLLKNNCGWLSVTGPTESTEGDPTTSPRSSRRSDHFQSHFARDLAQTLPVAATTNGYQNGGSGAAYPRVRFAIPERENHFPPGTISSSSLV